MATPQQAPASSDERLDALVAVLDLIRDNVAVTRPEIGRVSGLGRAVVTQRVSQLVESGLVVEGALGRSTGGRAPRQLRFRSDAGRILVTELGATSIGVGIADLAGRLLTQYEEPADIGAGPEVVLSRVEQLFDEALASQPRSSPKVWGVGVGVPGPVEFAMGRPSNPPIMPGWDNYDVRGRLGTRYDAATWVDNDVNLMALGELRSGLAVGEKDVVYLKVGSGIGAGLISGGRLHRGAQGAAGDVGHVAVGDNSQIVCRCGNLGCLEAIAGGAALARDAREAALDGRSPFLAERMEVAGTLEASDVGDAAMHGDPCAVELLTRAGDTIGRMLATLVNFYNPSLVIVGGGVASAGDLFLASIRQATYRRSLPLATRDLRIARSPLGEDAGLMGAAFVVVDELFQPERLGRWLEAGSPAGLPGLVGAT